MSSAITAQIHVHSNPSAPDRLEDFNRWYDEVHLPQVVERVDGIVAAHRLELADAQLLPEAALPARRFVAVYDVATDDIAGVLARLAGALGDGTLDLSDAIDVAANPPTIVVYRTH